MKVLGLTGSVGMGKSTTAAMFVDLGVPVFDADAQVHKLYSAGGDAVAPLVAAFGDIRDEHGNIDRPKLRHIVLKADDKMRELEAIVHPLTAQAQISFRERHAHASFVVLDIPLLFEVGSDAFCDHIAVVSAPLAVQRQRVLARHGMTEEIFQSILSKQLPDADKRARADFIISSAFGLEFARQHVALIKGVFDAP